MKTVTSSLLAAAVLTMLAGNANAQVLISWAPLTGANYVSGDSDISTNGTYFDAINTANGGFTTTTVGTTTFNALTYAGAVGTDGAISVDVVSGGTFNNIGFSGGSTAYNYVVNQAMLASDASVTIGSVTDKLKLGHTYQVEVWSYWNHGPYQASVQGSPTLNFAYPANQFDIGTFTAAATTETFSWTGTPDSNGAGFLNDVVVRDVTVPEPSTYAMVLGGLAFLALCVRRKGALVK